MSNVAAFVAAAEKAEPTLVGANDKDQAAVAKLVGETEGLAKDLSTLNDKLSPLTYLYSNSATSADVSLYAHLHPAMASAPASQHPTHPAVLRYFLQVQSLPPVQSAQSSLPNDFQPVEVDISALPTPERKAVAPVKKEKKDKKATAAAAPAQAEGSGVLASVASAVSNAAAAASATVVAAAENVKAAVVGTAGEGSSEGVATGEAAPAAAAKGKKEKKEKKEKPAKAPAPAKEEPTGPLPSMIDMRVGKVLEVRKHPEADSLYIEMIDVGEPEPRQVCSGLVKYMTEDQIRGETVITICNLKPATMRGVKSFAMLLCATGREGKEAGGVEFVLPPEGSQPGERVYFEGEKYENAKPEAQLNPKKKVFETIQPGFTTLEGREAAWIDPETKSVHHIRTKDGVCKAQSFVGASLS